MSGILFLAHRLPFPPDRGDKIRSHHVLKALAALAPVHVGCFGETDADMAHEAELASVATSHCLRQRTKPLARAGLEALWRGEPVSLAAFRDPVLAEWVEQTLAREPIDTIYVFSGQMGQYVPDDWQGRLVVDLVDVDSAKFEAYAPEHGWPMRWVHAREGHLLAREEARLAVRAERTLLVSEAEAAVLRERLHGPARVEALGNGIDATLYDPRATRPHGVLTAAPGPHIVFTGQMDYPPNVAAAVRIGERLMPAIRERHALACFHIVGRAPSAAVRALNGRNGCRVWGEVDDVRPFLAAADLVVAPLEIARGVQNKVLEAMAMACPVLLTPAAATGIPARDGEHWMIADSDDELVRGAQTLLINRPLAKAIGASARRFVGDRMSWPAALARLPEIVGRTPTKGPARDAA